jgi:transcription elongation factor Elf1
MNKIHCLEGHHNFHMIEITSSMGSTTVDCLECVICGTLEFDLSKDTTPVNVYSWKPAALPLAIYIILIFMEEWHTQQ